MQEGVVLSSASLRKLIAGPGDVDGNGVVNQTDLDIVSAAFGSYKGHPRFNEQADVWGDDDRVDIRDIYVEAVNKGKIYGYPDFYDIPAVSTNVIADMLKEVEKARREMNDAFLEGQFDWLEMERRILEIGVVTETAKARLSKYGTTVETIGILEKWILDRILAIKIGVDIAPVGWTCRTPFPDEVEEIPKEVWKDEGVVKITLNIEAPIETKRITARCCRTLSGNLTGIGDKDVWWVEPDRDKSYAITNRSIDRIDTKPPKGKASDLIYFKFEIWEDHIVGPGKLRSVKARVLHLSDCPLEP